MSRARTGRPGRRGAGKAAGHVMRNVPPTAPRTGRNGQKSAQAKRELARTRRAGSLRRAWNALRLGLGATLVTGAIIAAGWAGWRAFATHDVLALREVEVVGNSRVDKAAILEKAGFELGEKLPLIHLAAAEAAVRSLPGIGEVEVRRMYPSRIEIRIKEKQPVAMGYARRWYGLASDGTALPGVNWGRSDLPVIDKFGTLDSSMRAALGGFLERARAEYPDLYANFSQMSPRGGDGVEIILRDRKLKVLLPLERAGAGSNFATSGSNKSLISLEFLRTLQQQQAAALEPGKTVDLRVEGYAYVR
ncbi:MAG: FtsQ-type POTRA domain-containing protein [Fibrobacteres bacterium]|jgi:cell division protein FtsQ|nr:FtsQ-type POTRA domain-containing protein [Fibrobacterota bacterium]